MASEQIYPFSNATEYMAWHDANCADCPLEDLENEIRCKYHTDLFTGPSKETWKTIGGDERSWENGIPVLDWACKVKETQPLARR